MKTWIKVNLNARMRLIPTEVAAAALNAPKLALFAKYPDMRDDSLLAKAGQPYETELWNAFNLLGPLLRIGTRLVSDDNEIEIRMEDEQDGPKLFGLHKTVPPSPSREQAAPTVAEETNDRPSIGEMLAYLGWNYDPKERPETAVDARTGAVRISNGWGPNWTPVGYWTILGCAIEFASFQSSVSYAYQEAVKRRKQAQIQGHLQKSKETFEEGLRKALAYAQPEGSVWWSVNPSDPHWCVLGGNARYRAKTTGTPMFPEKGADEEETGPVLRGEHLSRKAKCVALNWRLYSKGNLYYALASDRKTERVVQKDGKVVWIAGAIGGPQCVAYVAEKVGNEGFDEALTAAFDKVYPAGSPFTATDPATLERLANLDLELRRPGSEGPMIALRNHVAVVEYDNAKQGWSRCDGLNLLYESFEDAVRTYHKEVFGTVVPYPIEDAWKYLHPHQVAEPKPEPIRNQPPGTDAFPSIHESTQLQGPKELAEAALVVAVQTDAAPEVPEAVPDVAPTAVPNIFVAIVAAMTEADWARLQEGWWWYRGQGCVATVVPFKPGIGKPDYKDAEVIKGTVWDVSMEWIEVIEDNRKRDARWAWRADVKPDLLGSQSARNALPNVARAMCGDDSLHVEPFETNASDGEGGTRRALWWRVADSLGTIVLETNGQQSYVAASDRDGAWLRACLTAPQGFDTSLRAGRKP